MASRRGISCRIGPKLLPVNKPETMKAFLKAGAALLLAGWTGSLAAFTYSDTDLLLVLRKAGYNDVLFNVGSISNYLGQPSGATVPVTNWDFSLVQSNFAANLSGVKYVLMAVTTSSDPLLRVWLSDADSSGVPNDETQSRWTQQRV